MGEEDVCTHTLLYLLKTQEERCDFIKNFCSDQFDIINFGRLAYCNLNEYYWLIVPLYVRLSTSSGYNLDPSGQASGVSI